MILLLYYLLAVGYAAALLLLYFYWQGIRPAARSQPKEALSVSVVVVIRNEENNIEALLRDLECQSYGKQHFEVIIVNDHSTDSSCWLVEKAMERASIHLRLLHLTGDQGKKAGIELGIRKAAGEVIAVTDGDCRVPEHWLSTIARAFATQDAVFTAGPVTYQGERSFFEKLQTVEFASLVGTGAAMLYAGKPGMCNAANMAFSKKAYLAVGGYTGNRHIPSGDDEFLLQALNDYRPGKAFFLKGKDALVQTAAQAGWSDFYQQRKRWAGKWRLHRRPSVAVTAIGLFLFYACWLVLSVAVCLQQPFVYFFTGALIKLGVEFLFLQTVLQSFGKKLPGLPFILLQLLYPVYVLFFGIAVNFGSFSWKGRTYKYANT